MRALPAEEPIAAVVAGTRHAVGEEGIDLGVVVRQSVVAAAADHRNLLVEGEDNHRAAEEIGRNLDLEEGILLRTEVDLGEDRMTFANCCGCMDIFSGKQ